ncbi:hypothetical protein M3J09_013426 [Ascochyta lentis]
MTSTRQPIRSGAARLSRSRVVNKQVKFTLTFRRLPKKVGVKPTQVIARLKQVIKQVKSSPQSPTYLLLDNCESERLNLS